MSCKDCEARRKMARDALLNAAFGKAVKHVIAGAAEIVGAKEKTGSTELALLPKTKPARGRKSRKRNTKTLTPAPPEH